MGEGWNKLSIEEGSKRLHNSLSFDMAYSSCRLMPEEKALYFHEKLMERIDVTNAFCFTNWYHNYSGKENVSGWDPVTEHTFDMVIVVMDKQRMIFTLFISED